MLARIHSAATLGLEARVLDVEVDASDGLPRFTIVGLPDATRPRGPRARPLGPEERGLPDARAAPSPSTSRRPTFASAAPRSICRWPSASLASRGLTPRRTRRRVLRRRARARRRGAADPRRALPRPGRAGRRVRGDRAARGQRRGGRRGRRDPGHSRARTSRAAVAARRGRAARSARGAAALAPRPATPARRLLRGPRTGDRAPRRRDRRGGRPPPAPDGTARRRQDDARAAPARDPAAALRDPRPSRSRGSTRSRARCLPELGLVSRAALPRAAPRDLEPPAWSAEARGRRPARSRSRTAACSSSTSCPSSGATRSRRSASRSRSAASRVVRVRRRARLPLRRPARRRDESLPLRIRSGIRAGRARATPRERARYARKLSGPLLDRIDLHVAMAAVPWKELARRGGGRGLRRDPRARRGARARARGGAPAGTPGFRNADLSAQELVQHCALDDAGARASRDRRRAPAACPCARSTGPCASRARSPISRRASGSLPSHLSEALSFRQRRPRLFPARSSRLTASRSGLHRIELHSEGCTTLGL